MEPSADSEMSLTIDGENIEACVPKSSFVPIRQYLDAIIFVNSSLFKSFQRRIVCCSASYDWERDTVQHFGGFTQFQLVKEI